MYECHDDTRAHTHTHTDEYYTAQVMQHTVHNGKTDTLLEYEDGEEERVNLFEEKFTLVKSKSKCVSEGVTAVITTCLLYTSPSPRDS